MGKIKFRHIAIIIFFATLLISCKNNKKSTATKNVISNPTFKLIAEAKNLSHCESVAFDAKRNVLYVSVQSEQEPHDGSIAKISLNGKILKSNFATGLNDPKGIALFNDKLYVSDITELVEIDLATGKIVKRYKGQNSEFLNDVAIDKVGNVYVSDMFTSSIYKLDTNGDFKNWFTSAELENPNGLLVYGNKLLIAAWGSFNNKNPLSAPKGRFLEVNTDTKQIKKITSNPIGNLDGLQKFDSQNFLLSDWERGKILKTSKSGLTTLFFNTEKSAGDILFMQKNNILALPIANKNEVLIYKIAK